MNSRLIYLLTCLLLVACSGERNNDALLETSANAEIKAFDIDLIEGYKSNVLTGKKIVPFVNSMGDTLISGIKVPAKGIKIEVNQADVTAKKITSNKNSRSAFPNEFAIPAILPTVNLSASELAENNIDKGNPDFVLISSTGDTIQTGRPIPAEGKRIKAPYPRIIKALKPRFKDAAKYNIQYLNSDQGLCSSNIWSILKDKRGNMWFASDGGGVSCYDGETMTNFDEITGLSHERVWNMLEDKAGNIWFGTNGGGVCKYNGQFFTQFSEKEGLSSNTVKCILEDKKGNLWFGTYNGGVCKYDGKSFTHYTTKQGLAFNKVFDIVEDRKGNLWFATYGGGVSRFDGQTFVSIRVEDGLVSNDVFSIIEDSKGRMWFGTYGGGVSMYDGEKLTSFTENQGLSSNSVFDIAEDNSGNIWFATNRAACVFNGKTFTYFREEEGLYASSVKTIFEDENGILWFGNDGGGVNIYKKNSFSHFTKDRGLSTNQVWSINKDQKGNIWFGTSNAGLNKFDGKIFTTFDKDDGLGTNTVSAITVDSVGLLWVSTYGGGIAKFDGKTVTNYSESNGLCSNKVMSAICDHNGLIWVATSGGGISSFNGESFTTYNEAGGLNANKVISIYEDKKGNKWIGSFGAGVSKFDGVFFTHYTEKEGLSSEQISNISEDHQGNLLFCTGGGGLNILIDNKILSVSTLNGLLSNSVISLKQDRNKHIWIASDNGLNELIFHDPNKQGIDLWHGDNISIISYDKSDGLKNLDFYNESVLIDQDNRIWWGSSNSLVLLNLKNHKAQNSIPSISLRHIDINAKQIDFRSEISKSNPSSESDFVIPFNNYPIKLELPSNQNHLTFYFAAIDWNAPQKIEYSYRMKGLTKNWSSPLSDAFADYRNLPYGTFTFEVKARSGKGIWSDPFNYTFTIFSPWWLSWWAGVIYIILFIMLIAGLVRLRTKALKVRQKELETEVEKSTHEILEQKKQVDSAYNQLERKNKEILDSINYAKRIQSAILPPDKLVKEYLMNSFVLYKPKDIVAGDFYWMEPKEKYVLFAAADCTGHGVPGAMVSVVCNNGLNRAVREYKLTDPGEILNKTREIVISEFEKSEEEVKDGMDIALCSLEGTLLKYSGANNPLWIIKKDSNSIIEIKADKQPIGKFDNPHPYTTHEIKLKEGDTIYIFSDGFADQFGGENDKKFKSVRLKKMLLSIQEKSMEEQRTTIDQIFEKWRGSGEQIDDVCFIGVRI